MLKVNLLLAAVLLVGALYLVRISYESRQLFVAIEREHDDERQLESDRRRLEAERQAQATHLRVERTARERLAMRAATPANTTYVVDMVAAVRRSAGGEAGDSR